VKSITGLLYSQIGYDLGNPMRAILRNTARDGVPPAAVFKVLEIDSAHCAYQGQVEYWGETWGSHWWVMDFSALNFPGTYRLIVSDAGQELYASDAFKVERNLLWRETIRLVALDQMEERARQARGQRGWKDCGSWLREVNSHASALIGLCDLLEYGYSWLEPTDVERLTRQIIHGCQYLADCQDKAESLGFGRGAMVHEIPTALRVLPNDVMQSMVALAHASRLLSETHPEKSAEYLGRAENGYKWLQTAKPLEEGFSAFAHGAPPGFVKPAEWMTRDLLLLAWGALELFLAGRAAYREDAVAFARQVLQRQVPKEKAEGEFYGHFYTFASSDFTEKAWVHHHVGHDTGATFPHYLIPLIEMCRLFPEHPEAASWRQAIYNFTTGYFLPACSRNPFYLLPAGYFSGEGLLSFGGLWHGINAAYAWAAALAIELESFLGERSLRQAATGNLQWLAGLNAGITADSLAGSLKFRADIPEGKAEPYSMIYGIGRRFAGSWSPIPGSICNGFDIDEQFQFNVPPSADVDGPHMFTDEDWITGVGGWSSALARLCVATYFFG